MGRWGGDMDKKGTGKESYCTGRYTREREREKEVCRYG
jgi:hypothetical protein